MTHDEAIEAIIRLAERKGMLYHTCLDSRKCKGAGFPDIVIASPEGLIFVEMKLNSFSKVSSAQVCWKYTLKASGQNADIYTTADIGMVLDMIEASL